MVPQWHRQGNTEACLLFGIGRFLYLIKRSDRDCGISLVLGKRDFESLLREFYLSNTNLERIRPRSTEKIRQ